MSLHTSQQQIADLTTLTSRGQLKSTNTRDNKTLISSPVSVWQGDLYLMLTLVHATVTRYPCVSTPGPGPCYTDVTYTTLCLTYTLL